VLSRTTGGGVRLIETRCNDTGSGKQTRQRKKKDTHQCYANDRQVIKAEENVEGDYNHKCCCGN